MPLKHQLYEYQNKCSGYKYMHEKQARNLLLKNKILNISSIIIVSFTATASALTENLKDSADTKSVFNIVYVLLLYFSAVLNSLSQFLKYEKEAEKHKTSSIRYTAMYNNIRRSLILDSEKEFNIDVEYFNWVTKEYDSIFSSSPDISEYIIKKFGDNFLKEEDNMGIEIRENSIPVNNESLIQAFNSEKLKYELDRFMISSYSGS